MHNLSIACAAVLLLCGLAVRAEDSLEQKRDAKLAEEWMKKAAWITDYDKALAESKASGKLIFAYFTRSYAY